MKIEDRQHSVPIPWREEASCALCGVGGPDYSGDFWNRPLMESANFAVIPSLGSLIEGWLLIVPRSHYLSAAHFPKALVEELDIVKREVSDALLDVYGWVCFFEHGPSAPQSTTGCSVDHAHVHAVPVPGSILDLAERLVPEGVSFRTGNLLDCSAAVASGLDYLYFEEPGGPPRVATAPAFESQVFRQAIAAHMGCPDDFNWRTNAKHDVVQATVQRLVPAFRAREGAGRLGIERP